MHPIMFQIGGLTVYGYGFMIAIGIIAGVSYMAIEGKREVGLTFDQANILFLYIFLAAIIGGKFFLLLEDPSYFVSSPEKLLSGKGFVFYGSFLFAIPTMLWFFKKNNLPVYRMLDVMAITTCLVHMFGRIGCFLAGCCYGTATDSKLGVIYSHELCQADSKGVPLHPTQLYEAAFIFLVMICIFFLRRKRSFYGQLFLAYMMLYAVARFGLEYFRGDAGRGYVLEPYLSHSQLVAFIIFTVVIFIYYRISKRNQIAVS
jgi:phosphatidylglycerol:prolipoprotein diacylglycerol transferase